MTLYVVREKFGIIRVFSSFEEAKDRYDYLKNCNLISNIEFYKILNDNVVEVIETKSGNYHNIIEKVIENLESIKDDFS